MKTPLACALAGASFLVLPGLAGAALWTDTADIAGSTVDVIIVNITVPVEMGRADGVNIPSGTVDLQAEETGGVFSSLTLTGGSFLVTDTTISLTSFPFVGGTGNLQSFGLGFTVDTSTFTLTSTGVDTYSIDGALTLVADVGSATATHDTFGAGYSKDFGATPESFSANLASNSEISITQTGPGTYSYTGSIRFEETEIDAEANVSVRVSSLNTIDLGGTFTVVPEPSTALLGFAGLLVALRRRR